MTAGKGTFAELRPDFELLVGPLFDLSETLLRKHGDFLPHGAVLDNGGQVTLVAAPPTGEYATSTEVLPHLHEALRARARDVSLRAVAVAESVEVTLEGKKATRAIKVLVEHARGLTVAFYMPFEKKLMRGFVMGEMFGVEARAEVTPWDAQSTNANPEHA